MSLLLLITLTAFLFNRPGDWIPALSGVPLYQITLISCVLLSIDKCSHHLRAVSVHGTPFSIGVIGLLGITFSSQVLHSSDFDVTSDLFKACVYYCLIVSIVDSQKRLALFINGVGLSIFLVGLLMVLNTHLSLGVESQPTTSTASLRAEALGGTTFDSNDTASLLVIAVLIFLANALSAHSLLARLFWISLAAILLHGIQLTDSRGGFLALVVGVTTYMWVRWGGKGLKYCLLLLPIAIAFIATDRMTEIDAIQQGTGQNRLQFWSMGLSIFFRNPLFGIGAGEYVTHVGKACHNTFIQSYSELGILGGTLFLSLFYLGTRVSFRVAHYHVNKNPDGSVVDATLFLVPAIFMGFMTSSLTLNNLYSSHTYLVLALASVLLSNKGLPINAKDDLLGGKLFLHLAAVSSGFILLTYMLCQLMVQW